MKKGFNQKKVTYMSNNSSMKVLAADDDEMNLFILTKILSETGYSPVGAEDGSKAWQYLMDHPRDTDILMIDRMMPGMNGLDLIGRARNYPELRFTPIIMQSGKVGAEILEEAYDAGAYHYLIKPFSNQKMSAMVMMAKYDVQKHRTLMECLKNPAPLQKGSILTFKTPDEACAIAATLAQGSMDEIGVAEALSEILINAIEHGNLEIGIKAKKAFIANGTLQMEKEMRLAQPTLGARHVTIQVEEGPCQRIVTVQDEGAGFAWQNFITFNTSTITELCGRGINKAIRILSKVEFLGSGNTVRCTFDLE